VLLEVHAKRLKESAVKPQRAPLNLALVLDRSKSMGGERLARVKVAAHRIIEELQPIDRLSIITFSDTADVIVPSTFVTNVTNLKAPISLMVADGATEIFKALDASYRQVLGHYNPDAVNHIILVTDGRTYGDEEKSLELASQAASKGIAISALGIGDEWNDKFLDDLTSRTGGAVSYISAPSQVVGFLNAHVRNLTEAFAERLVLTIAPEPDVEFESAFRLAPTAQPLGSEQSLQLGVLDVRRPVMVMLQFQMPARLKEGFRPFVRLDVTGDVLSHSQRVQVKSINDLSTETSATPPVEIPPANVVEALSKMTLHRMQQKAEEAIAAGDVQGATRRLENLATRLLELGQVELAQQAGDEARRVRQTSVLSEEGRRALKYGTRALYPISINNHKE
jgi:Ca-activated chloride channel family protein